MKRKKIIRKKVEKTKRIFNGILAAVVIFAVLALGYSIKTNFFPGNTNTQIISQTATTQVPTMSRMSLTSYDKALAKKMMDKNNDGKCDACGMPVEMCIDSGQMQCSTDPDATIGVLGSQHIHADWKIYINGEALSFEGKDHMGRMRAGLPVSSFIHVDSGSPAPEKTGDILHMHATGVPLWIFFESIGMKFNKDCLILENEEKYCNNNDKTLNFYVNGNKKQQYEKYIFNDLDKILISYGDENQQEIQEQLKEITNFADKH